MAKLNRWFSALWITALFPQCTNYVFVEVPRESIDEQQVVVPAVKPLPADILFIVDDSASMADEQERLAQNFDRFIDQILGQGDYQIAIVSTTLGLGIQRQGLVQNNYTSGNPRRLQGLNDANCSTVPGLQDGCFRSSSGGIKIVHSEMERQAQIDAFASAVRVGSCGSGQERGLRTMRTALQNAAGNGCNAGFIRPNANLVVIFVSDEEDFDVESSGLSAVQGFVNDLGAAKGGDFAKIRVASIVGSADGNASNCRILGSGEPGAGDATGSCGSLCSNPPYTSSFTSCAGDLDCSGGEICHQRRNQCIHPERIWWDDPAIPAACSWCSYYLTDDCCSALAGNGYVEFSKQVEARVNAAKPTIPISSCKAAQGTPIACLIDSICQANFGDTLARIARDLVLTNEYVLDPPTSYPPGVVVNLKGGRFPDGVRLENGVDFAVSPDGTRLTITAGDKTPGEGEELEIFYVVSSSTN